MYRMLLAWAMLGFVAVTAGCAMCDHPYDECFPLFTGECDGQPCVGPRAGTIRNPGDPVTGGAMMPGETEMYYEEMAPAQVGPAMPMQSRAARPRGTMSPQRQRVANSNPRVDVRRMIPKDAQVLSVTDATLEEAQAVSRTASRPRGATR